MNLRLLILPLALLTISAAPATSEREIDATLHRIYDPYASPTYFEADWQRPLFSRKAKQLIRKWQAHIGKSLTIYNDFAWFCSCQDWDHKAFRFERRSLTEIAPGRVNVAVHVSTGHNGSSDQSLTLVRERGRWVIDDMTSESMPQGMIAGLRDELAAPVEPD